MVMTKKEQSASPPPPTSLPSSFAEAYTFAGNSNGRQRQSNRLADRKAFEVFVPRLKSSPSSSSPSSAVKRDKPSSPTPTPSPPKKKKKKRRRLYDDPSSTSYPAAEYPPVPDHLYPADPNRRLDLLVCGLNPGLQSSQHGAHFRHPSNHFYRTLLAGGLTPTRVDPTECADMLDQPHPWPSIGLTNICIRPTAEGGELGKEDYMRGTPILEEKVRRHAKPRLMVFTGKGIGEWWGKCCRQLGGLPAAEKKRSKETKPHGRCDATISIKEEQGQDSSKRELLDPHRITLATPSHIPWAADEPSGLGLLDSVVELEDIQDGTPISARYCFLFVTTSPSGRVTTMHLPEKGEWMGKCKDTLDWLRNEDNDADGKVQQNRRSVTSRTFTVVDGARLSAPS
ncbi:DNA glycosylase [Jaminaea rosea]|uniref:DNA glycosylase n=1 Tax=Jaminaea rosea TaxID=1569628 RepID=A0A316UMN2_9BASI|nr:DNA glycosylase [Jaminaea rosea]PWN25183.1 DNA glycosylase [Jaminaea rosea]